jgi:short-subunit dehydrogenase
MELLNKTIVITGASKGLGRQIAIQLSKKKSNIILIARTKNLLEETQKEIEILTGKPPTIITCDITNENDVNIMAELIKEKFKSIDVLINNAGVGIHKNSEVMTNEEMKKQFAVNFYGVFYCIKSLMPLIKTSNSGYILNIGSLVSKVPFADNSIYAATKFALLGFSEGLRFEMKKYKIKVGLILPGLMNTSFQNDREGTKPPAFLVLNTQKIAKRIEKMIIKRRKIFYMHRWMLIFMKARQLFVGG